MSTEAESTSEHTVFPSVDRFVVAVGDVFAESDEKAFWLSKSPEERLEALELLRQIAYGYDPATTRLQRVIEVAEFPPR